MTAEPALAQMIAAGASGDASTDAVEIADGVFLSAGVTNSHLVTTSDGSVVVNAGSAPEAERTHQPRYRRIDPEPPRYVITTQSHRDHMGGVPVFSVFSSPRNRRRFLSSPVLGSNLLVACVDRSSVRRDVLWMLQLLIPLGKIRVLAIGVCRSANCSVQVPRCMLTLET